MVRGGGNVPVAIGRGDGVTPGVTGGAVGTWVADLVGTTGPDVAVTAVVGFGAGVAPAAGAAVDPRQAASSKAQAISAMPRR